MSADGKVVLVTGGSRGIGRASARLLAARGVRIAINYRENSDAAEFLTGCIVDVNGASYLHS